MDSEKNIQTMFSNEQDYNECLSIFHCINKCKLIIDLDIPSAISKEIAEYATGTIKPCSYKGCNNTVLILEDDLEQMCDYDVPPSNFIYIYMYEVVNKFYCLECMSNF